MGFEKMTSHKDIKKLLCKNIKLLSKKYKFALKSGGAGAREWLRDNYYLLSREGENALSELDNFKHLTVNNKEIPVFSFCMEAAKSGKYFYNALKETLVAVSLSTVDLEAIPVLMKACFVIHAATSFDADEQGSGVGNAVMGMRAMPSADFDGLIEEFCIVDKIFRSDPTGTYPILDDATKSDYRHILSKIAPFSNSLFELIVMRGKAARP